MFGLVGSSRFDNCKVFTSQEVLAIAKSYGICDLLLDCSSQFLQYQRDFASLYQSELKAQLFWLRLNGMLFKPLLVKYAMDYMLDEGDILTWHDCDWQKNPHYLSNIGGGRHWLELKMKSCDISVFFSDYMPWSFDVKPYVLNRILGIPLAPLVGATRAGIFSLRSTSIGKQFASDFLRLSLIDSIRLPFPDIPATSNLFMHHSSEQCSFRLALAAYNSDLTIRPVIANNFLFHGTRFPPSYAAFALSILRRSQWIAWMFLFKSYIHSAINRIHSFLAND